MKFYLDSIESANSTYPDFSSRSIENGERITFYSGRAYTKIGAKEVKGEKLSLYILRQEFSKDPVVSLSKKSTEKLHHFIFEQHLLHLKNLDIPNPSLTICLSGTFCMGKTTLAKQLEDELKGIRINADQVRSMLMAHSFSEEMVYEYLYYCLNKLKEKYPNRLIIMDRCIDAQAYERLLLFSRSYLIRLVVPREIVEQRIQMRPHEIHDTSFFVANLNKSWTRYEDFARNHQFDYVLNNYENDYQVPMELIESIKRVLNESLN